MMISAIGKHKKRKGLSRRAFSLIELIVTMTVVAVCLGIMLKAAVQLVYTDKKVREKKILLSLGDQLWFPLMDETRPAPGLAHKILGEEISPGEEGHYRPVNILVYGEGKDAGMRYASGYIQFP